MAKRKRREDPEAVPEIDPELREKKARAAEVADEEDEAAARIGKKRGPKKRVVVDVELPPEIKKLLATAPLVIIGEVGRIGAGVQVSYNPEAIEGVCKAFDVWAEQFDVQLTPGWAYLASVAVALSTVQVAPIAQPSAPAPSSPPAPSPDAAQNAKTVDAQVVSIARGPNAGASADDAARGAAAPA